MARAQKLLATPGQYVAARIRILAMAGGRNLDSRDLGTDIPKHAAKQLLAKMADGPYLKRISGGRYQRTNASGLDQINEIKAMAKSPESKPKTVARKTPSPYQHQQSSKVNQVSAQEKATKLEEIKAKILSENEANANKIDNAVEYRRLEAKLHKKPFDAVATRKQVIAELFPAKPAASAVRADLNTTDDSQVIPARKQDVLQE